MIMRIAVHNRCAASRVGIFDTSIGIHVITGSTLGGFTCAVDAFAICCIIMGGAVDGTGTASDIAVCNTCACIQMIAIFARNDGASAVRIARAIFCIIGGIAIDARCATTSIGIFNTFATAEVITFGARSDLA